MPPFYATQKHCRLLPWPLAYPHSYQATLRYLLSLVVGASVLALAAALSFAYLLFRQGLLRQSEVLYLETRHLLEQQGLLNQQLLDTNRILQRSEEQLAVTLNSIGDGVITTDALAQVTSLNPLAAQLTGWTLEQARGRRIEEVLQTVHKSSRELVPNPVMDALQYGAVQELAKHTVLLARDGSEYDIADI
jgi:PAS domain S-box-containing protein